MGRAVHLSSGAYLIAFSENFKGSTWEHFTLTFYKHGCELSLDMLLSNRIV